MPNKVNQLQVAEYKKAFQSVSFVIAIGYPKLVVNSINDLRGKLVAIGAKMLFVRNRLANIAMKELGHCDIMSICNEQTAFVWGEDPVSLARFLVDFKKAHAEIKLHGALVEGAVLDSAQVVELSKSPTKEELKSIISGQIVSMGGKLSAQMLAAGGLLASQVEKLGKEKDGDGEAAA